MGYIACLPCLTKSLKDKLNYLDRTVFPSAINLRTLSRFIRKYGFYSLLPEQCIFKSNRFGKSAFFLKPEGLSLFST